MSNVVWISVSGPEILRIRNGKPRRSREVLLPSVSRTEEQAFGESLDRTPRSPNRDSH